VAILSCSAISLLSTNVGKEMPISRIVVAVPNATVVLVDKLIEVRKDLVCCLLVTCLLHLGGTFLIRVRFFECPSFIHVTSPNNVGGRFAQEPEDLSPNVPDTSFLYSIVCVCGTRASSKS
jgi:hypothetical protein